MGTKGASGLKKICDRKQYRSCDNKYQLPVLVIPEVARFENFLKKEKTELCSPLILYYWKIGDDVNILKEIAMLIVEPKLRVLSVRPKDTQLPELKKLERNFSVVTFRTRNRRRSCYRL
jgi:hypothetical protein